MKNMDGVWIPPTNEISELEEVIINVVRAKILPINGMKATPPSGDGWYEATLSNNARLRAQVELSAPLHSTFEKRAVLSYSYRGHVSVEYDGHLITGTAILDVKRRCFLDCRIKIENVGRIASGKVA